MTPGARLQATIDLLEETLARPDPADRIAQSYFRSRRYIGSKDRRAIQDLLWGVWRHRARLGEEDPRSLALKASHLLGGLSVQDIENLCSDEGHAPSALTDSERQMLAEAALMDSPECPDWIWPKLEQAFGADAGDELAALCEPAPVDLRANTLKADRDKVHAALEKEGIASSPTPHAPNGLRIDGRAALPATRAYKTGLFDIQDEGSQLAAAAVRARPDMTVLDLCAGAGGKTLALAADMKNRGRIVACDIDSRKLDELNNRARRAGAKIIKTVGLDPERPLTDQLPDGPFDRILIDAPCSGSGTWRRAPDAKWRLTPEQLASYVETQLTLLSEAAGLLAPKGKLVYVTCSILPEENHTEAPGLRPVPLPEPWAEQTSVQLTPRRDGTDGFFIAAFGPE